VLLPLLTIIMLVGLFAVPLKADAAVTGKVHFFPARTEATGVHTNAVNPNASNLLYHGGPVMAGTAHVFAIFWEPTGSVVSTNYNSLITRYFNDVGGSTDYVIQHQYTQSGGSFPNNSVLSGTFVDTRAYPSNPMFDSDIQAEVSRAKSINGWASSINNVFFVFTAKNENECFDTSRSQCTFTTFCGYHSFFGSNTLYAFIPYTGTSLNGCGVPRSPNNNIDADSSINVSSHEQMEAATDPLLNAWFDSSGAENGDKCNFRFDTTNSANGDTFMNGHPYEVQMEWSNARRACRLNTP
jgi:hypothetical protein